MGSEECVVMWGASDRRTLLVNVVWYVENRCKVKVCDVEGLGCAAWCRHTQ
jgi:hypothetical protein